MIHWGRSAKFERLRLKRTPAYRFRLFLSAMALVFPGLCYPQLLVTKIEMQQHNGQSSMLQPMSPPVSGGPAIELLNPQLLSQSIKSPTRIDLLFKPLDSPVNLASFKVLYGKARFDITSRILKKAKVGNNSITVEEAELPEGEHRFAILISDIQGRLSSREFSVRVQ